MQIIKNLLTIAICVFTFNTHAQDKSITTISGTITHNNTNIEAVSISINGIEKRTTTSLKNGSYAFTNLKAGNYTIKVSAIGFITQQRSVQLSHNQNIVVDFTLNTEVRSLDNVSIIGLTKSQELKEAGFNVNAIELKKYANSTADLNQVLSRSSGINIREQGGLGSDFKFSVNGLSGKQVKFFIDGVPMENFGSSLTLNNIPVNLAERIEVYKGVVPSSLGADALGGAVNIVTNQNIKQYLDASYSYGSFNTHRAAITGRYTDNKTGLTFDISGFYNFSNNNYLMRNSEEYDSKIRLVVGEGNNQTFEYKDSKRFHDDFQSLMGKVDVSLQNKKWADLFKIGLLFSNQNKQIQTLATQEAIVGAADRESNFFMPSVKYRKSNLLVNHLTLDFFASYARDNSEVTDTSTNIYDWAGHIYKTNNTVGEFGREFSMYHYKNNFGLGQLNLNYELNENQSIQLNYNISLISRKGYDELDKNQTRNSFKDPNTINKNVAGISWQSNFLDGRLSSSLFGKYYGFNAVVKRVVNYVNGVGLKTETEDRNYNYFGYGLATRYKIDKELGIKFSAEHAYRLQDAEELFGDGITILANPDLKPEESNNLNLGAFYNKVTGNHQISIEAGGFIRSAKNFIYFTPTQTRYSVYNNELDVNINGIEGEIGYTYKKMLHAGINATYQNARRTNGYKDQVPNQPYLLGNGELSFTREGLFGKATNVTVGWYGQYIKDYFLSWPGQGAVDTKSVIPTQLIHNISVASSFENQKYTISIDLRNLTNELAYDDFKLQKPGRAMYVKLRYLIK